MKLQKKHIFIFIILLIMVLLTSLWRKKTPDSGHLLKPIQLLESIQLLEPIQRGTEVEFNCYFDDSNPQSIMWDLNADGTYDTTTSERTLVYDYGSYDTTQVIVKAVFDSLTFTLDTVNIALFDNKIRLKYDTLWSYSLATYGFSIFGLSEDGNTMTVLTESPSGDIRAFYFLRNKQLSLHDSIFYAYPFYDGSKYVCINVSKSGSIVRENEMFTLDTLGNKTLITENCEGKKYFTQNDSFVLIYHEAIVDIYSLDGKTKHIIEPSEADFIEYENIHYDPNLEIIAKIMIKHPILTVLNRYGDTLFVKNDIHSFPHDSPNLYNTLVRIDKNCNVYTITSFSSGNDSTLNTRVNAYSKTGELLWSDFLIDNLSERITTTSDCKYFYGYHNDRNTTKSSISLWDFQARVKLFDHRFEKTKPNDRFKVKVIYNEYKNELFHKVTINNKIYWYDKKGNQRYLEYPDRIFTVENPNLAYTKDVNKITVYKVTWE